MCSCINNNVLNDLLTESIVVLYNAGPLDVSWAVNSNKVVAILESFFPAQVSQNQSAN